jgi:hypothetical protein
VRLLLLLLCRSLVLFASLVEFFILVAALICSHGSFAVVALGVGAKDCLRFWFGLFQDEVGGIVLAVDLNFDLFLFTSRFV